jgi:hypothetical protein
LRQNTWQPQPQTSGWQRLAYEATDLGSTLEPPTLLPKDTGNVAVLAGVTARHDAIVAEGLSALREQVDVVVLAQASMSRVLRQLDLNGGSQVLTSPEMGVRHLCEVSHAEAAVPE